mmetsp:Transcript_96221/g.257252  ORF Transcript_96221/g.257252 Transcript_96221/m.257252 type:complete len:205 (-) Transcript_96221:613-1227(-)
MPHVQRSASTAVAQTGHGLITAPHDPLLMTTGAASCLYSTGAHHRQNHRHRNSGALLNSLYRGKPAGRHHGEPAPSTGRGIPQATAAPGGSPRSAWARTRDRWLLSLTITLPSRHNQVCDADKIGRIKPWCVGGGGCRHRPPARIGHEWPACRPIADGCWAEESYTASRKKALVALGVGCNPADPHACGPDDRDLSETSRSAKR